jgi:heat shock protein HtpX
MTEGFGLILEALSAYWTSAVPLIIVALCAGSMATLLYVFLTNAQNSKLRVSVLTGFYALTTFFWVFVAASLLICVAQSGMVAYRRGGVQMAAGSALVAALAFSALASWLVWRFGPRAILRSLAPRQPETGEAWLQEFLTLVAEVEGVAPIRLEVSDTQATVAMAIGGPSPRIVVSKGILTLLDREELESVLSHELMHVKNHDAEFKVFSRVFSRIMFFDPFSKFFDPALHREREYLADVMSGRATGKPASLASALLKLSKNPTMPRSVLGLSILGPGRGIFSPYPPLEERIRRLLALSRLLEGT